MVSMSRGYELLSLVNLEYIDKLYMSIQRLPLLKPFYCLAHF